MKKLLKKLIQWALCTKTLSAPRRWFTPIVIYALQAKRTILLSYEDSERNKMMDLINQVKKEKPILLSDIEAFQVVLGVKSSRKIDGDMAEVGVYQGGSAKLICEAKGDKVLHLFDTFEGIPAVGGADSSHFYVGKYAACMEDVKDYLERYDHLHFYEGVFPGTAEPVKDKIFSFVHIDVDTYESTLSCLKFFYPRMNRGGFIISHDYHDGSMGVRKAIDEFFSDKAEPIIEMSGSQCLLVKL